jgi:tRNA threonylcarbamoyladenosine modification (KEOPS) complex Cgi121 subunit
VPPVPAPASRTLQAVGARRKNPPEPTVKWLVDRLRALATESESLVALFDAAAIAGERHLLSAWAHLGRARSRGEKRLRDRGAELALYLSGEDQLTRALARVGVGPGTEQFVLIAERPREASTLLDQFGLVEDSTAYPRPPGAATLERLGIGAEERAIVPPESWEGLVLERVAFVDLVAAKVEPASPKKA